MVKIRTADKLGVAAIAAPTAFSWWLEVTGYHGQWLSWVTGLLTVAFVVYGVFLWRKWHLEKSVIETPIPSESPVKTTGFRFTRSSGNIVEGLHSRNTDEGLIVEDSDDNSFKDVTHEDGRKK
jgi:hypothetical protein